MDCYAEGWCVITVTRRKCTISVLKILICRMSNSLSRRGRQALGWRRNGVLFLYDRSKDDLLIISRAHRLPILPVGPSTVSVKIDMEIFGWLLMILIKRKVV